MMWTWANASEVGGAEGRLDRSGCRPALPLLPQYFGAVAATLEFGLNQEFVRSLDSLFSFQQTGKQFSRYLTTLHTKGGWFESLSPSTRYSSTHLLAGITGKILAGYLLFG